MHTVSLSQRKRFPREGGREQQVLHVLLEGTECSIKIVERKYIAHSGIDIFWWARLSVDTWISRGPSKTWINLNNLRLLKETISSTSASLMLPHRSSVSAKRTAITGYFWLYRFSFLNGLFCQRASLFYFSPLHGTIKENKIGRVLSSISILSIGLLVLCLQCWMYNNEEICEANTFLWPKCL